MAPSANTAVKHTERRRNSTWTRPDRQRAIQSRQQVDTFTIKVGLKALVSDPALRQCIEQTVRDLTQLQWETARIVHLYVLHQIEHNQPIYVLDRTFFYRALVCATGSSRSLLDDLWRARDELYTPQRADHLPWISGSNRTQLFKVAAGTLHANAMNHVKENLYTRLRKWCAIEVERRLPQLGRKWRTSLACKFCAAIYKGDALIDEPVGLPEAPGFTQQGVDDLNNTLTGVLEERGDLVPVTTGKLRRRWQEYLPWLRDILADFEAYYQEAAHVDAAQPNQAAQVCAAYHHHYHQQQQQQYIIISSSSINNMNITTSQHRNIKHVQAEAKRRKNLIFSILPNKGFKAAYIALDTACLRVSY